jgi:maleylacetoacetate isomerase
MADVVLAPTVEAAMRWGVDFGGMPVLEGVYERVRGVEAVVGGDWRHQADTPEEYRVIG